MSCISIFRWDISLSSFELNNLSHGFVLASLNLFRSRVNSFSSSMYSVWNWSDKFSAFAIACSSSHCISSLWRKSLSSSLGSSANIGMFDL